MDIFSLRRDIKDIRRLEKILSVLSEEGLHYFASAIKGKLAREKKFESFSPGKARTVLEKLGPTFIKLGQLLSLRPDLIPHEYCEEFKKLQDNVPSFSHQEAKQIIENDLEKPLSKLFKDFEEEPFSAASISQVHMATLITGEKVVVKIQRPNIVQVMEADIDIMLYLASVLAKHDGLKSLNLVSIVEEFREYTMRELDFRFELRNIEKFYSYFKDWKDVKIPKPYLEYSGKKVLVMEYIDGIKLTDVEKVKKAGYAPSKIAEIGFKAVIYQIFDLGIFHADPHPANLIIVKPSRLVFIDFGIVGFVDKEIQENILKTVTLLINKDVKSAIKYFLRICTLTEESDVKSFIKESEILGSDWHGTTFREMRFTTLVYEIIRSAGKNRVNVPSSVVLIAKSLLTIEGTGFIYDPDFNITEKIMPILTKIILKKFSPEKLIYGGKKAAWDIETFLADLPEKAEGIIQKLEDGEIKVKLERNEIRNIESTMDRNSTKRSLSMIIASLIIGSAIFSQVENQPVILNQKIYIWWFLIAIIFLISLIGMFFGDLKYRE